MPLRWGSCLGSAACAASLIVALRRRGGRGGSAGAGEKPAEFGVETIDECTVWGDSAEHLEARAVMGELGADRGFVKPRRWQQRELSDFGDLVRGEDRQGVGVGVRDAVAQFALARVVVADRRIV